MFHIDPRTGNTTLIEDVARDNLSRVMRDLQSPELPEVINLQNKEGNTALHYAIRNPEILELLLNHGANPLIPNNQGHTVYDYVLEYAQNKPGYRELKQLIQSQYPQTREFGNSEEIEEISLFDQIKLYVWDFDCTISNRPTCQNRLLYTTFTDPYTVVSDVDLLRRVILNLRKYGKKVAIASYGEKRIILRTIEKIFGRENPFTLENIITPVDVSRLTGVNWPECHDAPPGYNKNVMIRILQDRFRARGLIFNDDEILLIDDRQSNINNAKLAGYYGIKIPSSECRGFNRNLSPYLLDVLYKRSTSFPLFWSAYLESKINS